MNSQIRPISKHSFFLRKYNKVLSPVKLSIFIFMKKASISHIQDMLLLLTYSLFFFILVFKQKKYENSITTKKLSIYSLEQFIQLISFWYGEIYCYSNSIYCYSNSNRVIKLIKLFWRLIVQLLRKSSSFSSHFKIDHFELFVEDGNLIINKS